MTSGQPSTTKPPDRAGIVREATRVVASRLHSQRPRVGIVLGSGLGGLAARVEKTTIVPYREIPGFPPSTVAGHEGELVAGLLGGVPVVMQSGRFHLYEGHDADTVVLPVRVFTELGIEYLIATNAAGGIRRTFVPPALMLVADHVNLMWRNPLLGPVLATEERFPDMSDPYDPALRRIARAVARNEGVSLEEGVYLGVLGPSYETPAEIGAFERMGVDAVGMSTVPEILTARARGVRCLGFSVISNVASGRSLTPLTHDEVLAASRDLAGRLEQILLGVLGRLP